MIGAVVYRFRTTDDGWLPCLNGRLMHAAFFAQLQKISPELSSLLHDHPQQKPFSLSMLRPDKKLSRERRGGKETWQVQEGASFSFRMATVSDEVLAAVRLMPQGEAWIAGGLPLTLEESICDSQKDCESGCLSEEELIGACLSVQEIHEISFRFLSPTTFRVDDRDFPFPVPDLVFGSLASKWNDSIFSVSLDKEHVKEMAKALPVRHWQGSAVPVYPAHDRGVTAFTGEITYDFRHISLEIAQLFLLLAQFSTFLGVGRLTAQGFGQSRIRYR